MSDLPSSHSSTALSIGGWLSRTQTPYCLLDTQGVIIWSNAACKELFTGSPDGELAPLLVWKALENQSYRPEEGIIHTYFSQPTFSVDLAFSGMAIPVTLEGTQIEGDEIGRTGETFYMTACKVSGNTRPQLSRGTSFETLYNQTRLPLYLIKTDLEGRYTYMCHRFMRRFGIGAAYIGTNSLESIVEEDQPRCQQAVMDALFQPGLPVRVDLRKPLHDGRYIHTCWEFTAVVDEKGTPVEIACLGVDIIEPERKENDQEVLLEYTIDGLIKLNENGAIMYVSPFWEENHGHSLKEAHGTQLTDFVPEDEYKEVQAFLATIVSGKVPTPLMHRIKNADASLAWVETRGRRIAQTGEIVLVCRDLTESFQFRDRLLEKEEMLEAAGELAKIGGWTYNVESGQITWTTRTYHIKEVPLDYEITFERAMSFYPEPDRTRLIEAVQLALQTGKAYDLELNFVSAKGTKRIVRAIGQAALRKGKVVRLSGTILDVTEQKRTQDALEKQRDLLNQTQQIGRIGGWEVHVQTGLIEWTDEVFRIHGLPVGTPPSNEEAFAYYHPDDQPLLSERFRRCAEALIPFDESVRFRTARNEELWLRVTGKATFEEHKGLVIRGIMQDITSDIHIRKKLEKAYGMLALSQELTSIGSYEADMISERYTVSDNFIRTFGLNPKPSYTFEEIRGLVHPDDVERVTREFEEGIKKGGEIRQHLRCIRPDGKILHVVNVIRIRKDEHGVPVRFDGAMQDVTDQTLVRLELEKTYEHLTTAQAMARLGSFELDFKTMEYKLSATYREIFGLDPEAHYNYEEIHALVHPDDIQGVTEYYQSVIAEQGDFRHELRFIKPNGEEVYVYDQSVITYDENGIPVSMIGYLQDITERKRNLLKIQENEERLRLLTENMDEVFWLRSADNTEILYINPAYEKVWGHSVEELYKDPSSFFKAIHPDDLGRISQAAEVYAKTGFYNQEHRIRRPDGTVRWIWARQQAIRDESGQILSHTGIATDITDRKEDREQIAMLQSVVERGKDSILITRAEPLDMESGGPEIIYVNEAFTEMTGYTAAEVIGKTPRILQGKETNRAKLDRVKKALKNWETIETELVNYKKDGSKFWVNFIVTPIANEKGQYTHWVSIQRDITRRKEQEFEIIEAKDQAERASQAKTEFLSTMSHEIRTPLNAVIGMTGMLQDTHLDAEQEGYVRIIRQGGENLLSVINNILDFNKIEGGHTELEKEFFPLLLPIEETLEMLAGNAHRKGLELIFLPHLGIPKEVKGDITRLRQVLVNLISNAIKFTEAGHVCLELGIEMSTASEREMLLNFKVSDTGVGIPKDKLHRLFKSFSQVDASIRRKHGGSGLGLAISQKLVELHGGQISVESQEGKGSTFSFSWKVEMHPDYTSALNLYIGGLGLVILDPAKGAHAFYQGMGYIMDFGPKIFSDYPSFKAHLANNLAKTRFLMVEASAKNEAGEPAWKEIRQLYPQLPLIWVGKGTLSAEDKEKCAGMLQKPLRMQEYMDEIRRVESTSKDAVPQTAAPKPAKETIDLSAFKILLVEDNPINLRVATRILGKFRARVETAQNGQEAVDFMKMGRFDLVLMDMQMPVMDGVTATKHIRKMSDIEQPLIVAMTANVMQEDRDACLNAGMNDFITKPIKVDVLRKYLQKWLLDEGASSVG